MPNPALSGVLSYAISTVESGLLFSPNDSTRVAYLFRSRLQYQIIYTMKRNSKLTGNIKEKANRMLNRIIITKIIPIDPSVPFEGGVIGDQQRYQHEGSHSMIYALGSHIGKT